jgi:diguanylate cyclase (GGDEF)-like protein
MLCFAAWYIALNRRLRSVMKEKDVLYHKLQKHAYYDDLTLLPSRRLLYDRIEGSIQRAKRKNGTFAICLIDLDNFKKVNDQHGHMIGDQVLSELGSRLLEISRGSDSIGRYGGDEFIVILEDCEDQRVASEYMTRLKVEIDKPIIINNAEFHVSLSYGEAFYPADGISLDELILAADRRMYSNKQPNKNE